MQTAFFTYKQATLCYHKIGRGSKILLFFHGYGQHGKVFEENSRFLQEEYTCYLFDLFFHGESTWGYGEEVLTKDFWNDILKAFLNTQHIERFSLAGFSMGGRFVFATLEAIPQRVEAIYLMAPDGVKTNFWYNLATYPTIFRKLFRSMILHPSYFYSVANVIHKLGLVDKGLIRFAESQMKTEEMRSRVYHSWVVLRELLFDMRKIASLIRKHGIPTNMVLGKFDKVITIKNMQHLLKHLPECKVELLDTGHNGIISQWKP
ncbi:alpha/beta hydrolase [Chryseotalea sanaruensis]|uniref:Alpha/beta hydrolase n=1 Tax=Chryseotalea sanaruensis TaxID=2482724 RepID=A0A401UEQ4_9BACT|nr:alpha/beta hydrolase [Chryseotalea sanaruensis]GCC53391.1 alpha/beta hydrolase [Chryseotalea sanaruensis]